MPGRATSHASRAIRCVATVTAVALAIGCASSDTDTSATSPTTTSAVATTSAVPVVPATTVAPDGTAATDVPEPHDTASTSVVPAPLPEVTVGDAVAQAAEPVDIAVRPGTDEVYVAERLGRVRRLGPDGLGPALIDVSAQLDPGFEEGLLGLVFAPDGSFLYLQTTTDGRTTVSATPVRDDGTLDADARREVYGFDQPYEAHNGGDLAFGPDGHLYVFSGDGGFVADPERRALDLSSPLGKLLRIDPTPDGDEPYRIPADNPFVDDPDALDEIWSLGLRNPWRGSFDPLTGDLWIGDVGDFAWEEVNVAWADEGGGRGTSFGWSAFEGSERFNLDQPADGHEPPFFEYPHGDEGCSIAAGERYRGALLPELQGWFVFADFCTGIVRALEVLPDRTAGRVVELGVVPTPVSVRAGPGDELYVVSIDGGIHPLVAR